MLGFGFTFPYALTLLGKLKRKYVYPLLLCLWTEHRGQYYRFVLEDLFIT
jgi:hypothetical protein